MIQYETVVAAIDLTPDSKKVLDVAKGVVNGDSESIYAVYVVEPAVTSYPIETYVQGISEDYNRMLVEARLRMQEIGDAANIPRDNQMILAGSPSVEVPEQAAKLGAELLVIGRHTKSTWEFLFGSTGSSVINSADCDVLTVSVSNNERASIKTDSKNELRKEMIKSPTEYFKHPQEVSEHSGLDHSDRINILRSWKHEVVARMKATEENFGQENGYELEDLNDTLGKEIAENHQVREF